LTAGDYDSRQFAGTVVAVEGMADLNRLSDYNQDNRFDDISDSGQLQSRLEG
jgi:hypothetical protein